MEKYRLNNILSLAESFEFQSLAARNDRVWTLKSLISLAENATVLRFFLRDLSNLVGAKISIDDLKEWLNINATIMHSELDRDWATTTDKYSSFLEAFVTEENKQFVYSRIYKMPISNEAKDFLKIKESSLLQGFGSIPPLYFYKVIPLNQSPGLANLDQKYLPYMFMAETFRVLFGTAMDEDFAKRFTAYIDQHKHKLNKIASFITKVPKVLGRGTDGVAFDIGPQYVLKIFRDKKAFQDALSAMHRLHKNPALAKTEAMIYDADSLGEFDGQAVFYYVMEKMTPAASLPEDELNQLTTLVQKTINSVSISRDYWRKIKSKITDPKHIEVIKKNVTEGVAAISEQLRKSDAEAIKNLETKFSLRRGWLESLIEEIIMKYLTGRTDLHMGNLGLTGYGDFRYFDPGYGGHVSNINYTKIIDQNAFTV